MPIITGQPITPTVALVNTPIVQIKKNWSDKWQFEPTIVPTRAATTSSAHDLGSFEFQRQYGRAMNPHQTNFDDREPVDWMGYWVRLQLASENGLVTSWVGRVYNETRDVKGGDVRKGSGSKQSTGTQKFTAYEALKILQNISLSQSYWLQGSPPSEQLLDWMPAFNIRDDRNTLVGNRSSTTSDAGGTFNKTFLFGGTDLWSYADAIDYILSRFVDESMTGGPKWTLSGQIDPLFDITAPVVLSTSETVSSILRKLIPTRLGFDYVIIPNEIGTDAGFDVFVYALNAVDYSFGGVTIPLNPNFFNVDTKTERDREAAIVVRSSDQKYSRIRVLGARMIVCCSLEASTLSLVTKWDQFLDTRYQVADGGSDEDVNDKIRKADVFLPVYQVYGAPNNWDLNGQTAAPVVNLDGTVDPASDGNFQNTVRSTLNYLPLREGLDYSTDPPTNLNFSNQEPDLLPASVWVFDEEDGRYILAEEAGISVSVRKTDWGVMLSANPNHLLALNHFSAANPSATDPKYDYNKNIATIAFRGDKRLKLGVDLVANPKPSDGVKEIIVDDAELWYLVPNTVVGVSTNRVLLRSGSFGRVLRNDATRLALVMAGAIARYFVERNRAEVRFLGLAPMSDLVGQILGVIEQSGNTQTINAPITSVEWQFDANSPKTIVRTGFAGKR